MAEWTPIENSIFMTDLINRWRDIKIDGNNFNTDTLANLVRNGQLTAYDKKDWIIKAGHKIWRGQKRPPQLGLNGIQPFPDEDIIIFDMDEALIVEKQILSPITNTDGPKMIGDKFVFTESQLIKKEDLYKRWAGATYEEIAKHHTEGELDAFKYYKGPINDMIWCSPGAVYYRGQVDWANPDLYEYRDSDCDYFLSEDMGRCEAEHPEYIGNVTPESLGLAQTGTPEGTNQTRLHAGLITLSAYEAINRLKITPIELVDILNGVSICDDYNNYVATKRLVTTDEEGFRAHTYNEPYFTEEALKNVKIYQLNFDRYCEEWGIQEQAQLVAVDTSGLESQLAEAQKQLEDVEGVRRWNKQFLTERAELQNSLAEKDARIAELEKELVAAKAGLENGKGLADVVCRMRREGKSDEEIAAHLHDDGKWCSQAQVGALLHADKTRVTADSMQQRARRLLGKA